MIIEDYVSFEVAKLLVQKGLMYNNAEYESYYTLKGEVVYLKDKPTEINIAPRLTLQTACKWLREVHHIILYLNQVILVVMNVLIGVTKDGAEIILMAKCYPLRLMKKQ